MENKIYSKVFGWMFIGLLISFATGYYVSLNENILYNIFSSGLQFLIYIAEIALVVILTRRINKMEEMTAKILFCLYSFVSGLTFGVLFVAFEISSIIFILGLTALIFGIFAFIGATTKVDLSKISTILFMGLIGVIIATIVNYFINSTGLGYIISWLCIIIFMGLTAYDMQKIRRLQQVIPSENKAAILGALELYLDFINIFIELLRLFGKSRD